MAEFQKKCAVELSNNHNEIFVEFDRELLDSLVEDDGWIELIRNTNDNKEEHRMYSPVNGPIVCIKWIKYE